jgi:hypothetical protein
MYISLGKHWELEINFSYWNPLDHIAFRKSIDLHFRDEDSEEFEPSFYVNFTFIFFTVELFLGRENTDDYE